MFKNCNLRIIKNIVSVYKNFNNKTNLETQFLFGEKVKIINEKIGIFVNLKMMIIKVDFKNAVGSLPEPIKQWLNTLVFLNQT